MPYNQYTEAFKFEFLENAVKMICLKRTVFTRKELEDLLETFDCLFFKKYPFAGNKIAFKKEYKVQKQPLSDENDDCSTLFLLSSDRKTFTRSFSRE